MSKKVIRVPDFIRTDLTGTLDLDREKIVASDKWGLCNFHMHGRRVVPEGIDGESRSSGTELGPGDRFYSKFHCRSGSRRETLDGRLPVALGPFSWLCQSRRA